MILMQVLNHLQIFLINIAKQYLPNKIGTIRGKDKPWMRKEIRKQIRKRKRIHISGKRPDTKALCQSYRIKRNKYITLITKAKADYYESLANKLTSFDNGSSKTWYS